MPGGFPGPDAAHGFGEQLLQEVRALRVAIERMTVAGTRAQLLFGRLQMQEQRMTSLGLYRDKVDGRAGMLTRAALGAYQKANGLKLDCWPTAEVLAHMRARR